MIQVAIWKDALAEQDVIVYWKTIAKTTGMQLLSSVQVAAQFVE